MRKSFYSSAYLPVGLYILVRLMTFAALPLEGLLGYGDFIHFYGLSDLGWPYLDYWSEFPPVFPLLSRLLYLLAGGREHVFYYSLAFILVLAEAAGLVVFLRVAFNLFGPQDGLHRGWIYLVLLLGIPYGYWYFDPLAVLCMLLGLALILDQQEIWAGVSLAVGMLIKLFPGLALVVAWRYLLRSKALVVTILAIGLAVAVYAGIYLVSPQMTRASIVSQAQKGSWETIWALLDGNLHTGNFGPEIERYDPGTASLPRGNPALISPWLSLIILGGLGALLFYQYRKPNDLNDQKRTAIAFLGLTWCLFLVWTPGYSPQWVLYLLPLILLALPEREAILMGITMVLINLLEWPVLLSRGYFWGLWLTIPLRTFLLILCGVEFWKASRSDSPDRPKYPAPETI